MRTVQGAESAAQGAAFAAQRARSAVQWFAWNEQPNRHGVAPGVVWANLGWWEANHAGPGQKKYVRNIPVALQERSGVVEGFVRWSVGRVFPLRGASAG